MRALLVPAAFAAVVMGSPSVRRRRRPRAASGEHSSVASQGILSVIMG
jgi:hypothetical protein